MVYLFCSFDIGQIACLILGLTMADLLTTLCGVMGCFILEVLIQLQPGPRHLLQCSYYIIVCLVCLHPRVLARLQETECKLILFFLLPVTPELAICGKVTTRSNQFLPRLMSVAILWPENLRDTEA